MQGGGQMSKQAVVAAAVQRQPMLQHVSTVKLRIHTMPVLQFASSSRAQQKQQHCGAHRVTPISAVTRFSKMGCTNS